VSAIQICTPVAKKSKYMEKEVRSVYSRILLSWKLLMFVAKKSKWTIRFITEQPRLNLLSQGILHLATLQPIHRNAWEKSQSRLLATTIYEDLKRMGAMLENRPLRLALEFLKRKGVIELLAPRTPTVASPIDRFYRLKYIFASKEELGTSIIEECHKEFPTKVEPFRPKEDPIRASPSSSSTPSSTTPSSFVDTQPSSASIQPNSASDPQFQPNHEDESYDFDDEFGDVEFEDVVGLENEVMETPTSSKTVSTEQNALAPGADSMETYRSRNRKIEDLINQIHLLRQKVTSINDRSEWLSRQRADYDFLLRKIDAIIEKLSQCLQVNTDVLASIPDKETQLVIDVSSRSSLSAER